MDSVGAALGRRLAIIVGNVAKFQNQGDNDFARSIEA